MDEDSIPDPFIGTEFIGFENVDSVPSDGAITLNGVLPLKLVGKGEAYVAGFKAAAAGQVDQCSQKKYWDNQHFWEGVLDYSPPKTDEVKSFARIVVITDYRK